MRYNERMSWAEVVAPVTGTEPGASPAAVPSGAVPSASTEDEGYYENLAEVAEFRDVMDPERHVQVPPS